MRFRVSRKYLLASSLLGGWMALSMATTPASAQTAPSQDQDPDEQVTQIDEIVVTGSRIAIRDNTGSSPIVTVGSEALEEIGTGTIETYLNALPQLNPSLTKTNNNPGSGGSAFLDLRQLGPGRSLVLVDGRRLVPGSSFGAVDVSVLPSTLIDRVEIITGGASAVYGADAVAGVVNFILKDDFEGVEVSGQYAISERGDGEERQTNLIAGGAFAGGRGHATFAVGYLERDPIQQTERDVSSAARLCFVDGCVPNGSPTTGDGTFSLSGTLGTPQALQSLRDYFISIGQPAAANAVAANNRIGFNPDGSLFVAGQDAFNGTGVFNYQGPNGADSDLGTFFGYNFNPVNLLQAPFERYNFYTTVNYELSDRIEFYGSALYSDFQSTQALAESPASFTIPIATTATLTPAVRAALLATGATSFNLARRTVELGPRVSEFDVESFQLVGGFRGTLPPIFGNEWSYDVYATHGEYTSLEELKNYPEANRVRAALAGCPAGSPTGPVAPSTGRVAPCVPLNPFGANSITQAQQDYIRAAGQFELTEINQNNVVAAVSGDLFSLPAGPLGFALGAEYRSIDYSNTPPEAVQTGSLLGGNSAGPVVGGYDVYELFGELRVPILADIPFAQYLGLEGGYRTSDYSLAGTGVVDTFKYGGEWAPTDWLRFRALQQRAVRAPSVGELFTTRAEGFPGSFTPNSDPCSATSAARTGPNGSAVLALCQSQAPGVNMGSYVSVGTQIRTFSGGNINLAPEEADTTTYGFVFRSPSSFPAWANFTATVDYFDIEIQNVISSVGFATSLARCYDPAFNPGLNPNYALCQNIVRDPSTGYLTSVGQAGSVSQTNANLARFLASGVDLGLTYTMNLADYGLSDRWGRLSFTTQGTWYENNQFESLPGDGLDDSTVGTIGDGTPGQTTLPEFKFSTRVAWTLDDVSLSLRWSYIDSVIDPTADPSSPLGGDIPGIDAYNYFYLNGSWKVTEQFEIYGGIDNLFDKDPPVYTSGFQFGTDPSTYDVVGRFFYIGARARF